MTLKDKVSEVISGDWEHKVAHKQILEALKNRKHKMLVIPKETLANINVMSRFDKCYNQELVKDER